MDAVAITVGVSWLLTGLLCIALSIPLVKGHVPRNALYGVRFPAAFRSDEDWLAINRFGGKQMIGWSIPMILIGIISLFLPLQQHVGLTLTLGFAPLVFVFAPLVITWRFAQRQSN